jgi:VCBS repeat protein/FG-GAP repeat protein
MRSLIVSQCTHGHRGASTAAHFLALLVLYGVARASTPGAAPIVADSASQIAVADFNGDHRSDLAVVNDAEGTVAVYLQQSSGRFPAVPTTVLKRDGESAEAARYALTAGDLNRDGAVDVVLTKNKTSQIAVFLGKGDGTFSEARLLSTPPLPTATAVGDFDGDGTPDLAVVSQGTNKVAVLKGSGDGGFTRAGEFAAGQEPTNVIFGDFGTDADEAARDGRLDIAVLATGEGAIVVLFGDGKGGVSDTTKYPSTGSTAAVAADFNSDGLLDVATAKPAEGSIGILLGRKKGPDGSFTAEMLPVKLGASVRPSGLAVADFDGDGHLDLAVAAAGVGPNGVFVLLNRPRPNMGIVFFDPPTLCGLPGAAVAVAAGDFAATGRGMDVAVAHRGSNTVSLLLGNGTGGFSNCGSGDAGTAVVPGGGSSAR